MRLARLLLPAAVATAVLLSGCRPDAPAARAADGPTRVYGTVPFKPCVLGGEQGLPPLEAQCGSLRVAEDPARPNGRRFALNIAWLQAESKNGGTPDPVFFLAGGPGQAATEVADQVNLALREVRRQRDVLLIDQRGSGQSNPLDCRDARGRPLEVGEPQLAGDAQLQAYVAQCLKSLEGRADPRFYTTGQAIADLETVRAALGVDKVNLIGASYGTRVAQQYAMHYPQHVRSVVLDGVVPNRLVVGGEFARRLDEALARQDAQCARQPACKAKYGENLIGRLMALKQRLKSAPVPVSYRDPTSNELKRETLTADTLTGLVHGVSYVPQLSSLLPLVASEAEHGRYGPAMAMATVWSKQMGGMNRGMQWSVICTEDAPRHRPDPKDAGTVLGADIARLFFAACRQWPRGEVARDFTAPFESAVPALLLSGELDPVTPPVYGDEVAKRLRNGRQLVLRGQGHGAMIVGCMPKLLGQFLETADTRALDARCLQSLDYVPPFTSFNGWEP